MQAQTTAPRSRANLMAVLTFVLVFAVIMIIAVMNAPARAGADVMKSTSSYLAEVRKTAIPFLLIVGVGAAALGLAAAVVVRREWPHPRRRRALIAGYAFLAPYLLVTFVFTVGVILFALYIAFNEYDIFTEPQWVGLKNFGKAFEGLTKASKKEFVQALHNVLWCRSRPLRPSRWRCC
jgi:uncharacterized membrane protein YhaH (DUF805 family)